MAKGKSGKTKRVRGFDLNPDPCKTCKGSGVVTKTKTTIKIVKGKLVRKVTKREVKCTQCDGTGANFHN